MQVPWTTAKEEEKKTHLLAFQLGLLQLHVPLPIDRPRLVELILQRHVILGHLVECREQFLALVCFFIIEGMTSLSDMLHSFERES
jgi:hypothetical protein